MTFRRAVRRSLLCLALTVALVAGTIGPVGAEPAPAPESSAGTPVPAAAGPLGAVTTDGRAAETAALQSAAETGRTVEVPGSISETARTLATPRGTLVRESHIVPRWTNRTGVWRQIDLTLRRDGATVAPAASVADVHFSAGGTAPLVALHGRDGALRLSWPGLLPAPRLAGDTAVYESVLPDIDLQVQSTVDGFGYALIVKTRQAAANPALAKLRFGLTATGWSLRGRPGGGYEARDTAGAVAASAGPALMWDATSTPGTQRSTIAGTDPMLRSVPDGSRKSALPTTVENGSLVIVPDAAMLADPAVTFPVVIDPWTGVNRTRWGYANTTNQNRDDGIVRVGVNTDGSGTYRSFFAFDLSWLPGKQIRGAKFITTMTHSWSCDPTPVNLYRTQDLTASGRQGWDGPDLQAHIESKSGNAHKPSVPPGCEDDPQPNMYMEFSNQTLLNDVINYGQGRGNYTLALSARDSDGTDEGTGNRWKKFDQASTVLSVEYNNYPNTPAAPALTTHTDYTAAGHACITGTTRPAIRSTTPWLKATVSDPDGDNSGQLAASFALQRLDGATWTGVTGWPKGDSGIPSGSLAEVQVPAGTVTGGTLRWQVRVADALGAWSNWSPWCEFTLDTTPPGVLPTVATTEGRYPESPPNDVLQGSVGYSGQFTFGANGVTDVVEYEYQLDGGAKAYVAATATGGPATVWVTPTHAGEHVLTVRSRDAAQNASPPKDYRFLVNSPSAPTAVWKVNEGAGTTLNTSPAGGPTATVGGGATWTDGRVLGTHTVRGVDRALRFDGSDDFASTAGAVLDTSKSFSAGAWVRFTGDTTTQRTVLCQEGAMTCGFAVNYLPAPINRWALVLYGSDIPDAPTVYVTSAAPPAVGTWTHLAVSWDAGLRSAKLYVDGTVSAQITRATNWNATGPLVVGGGKFNGWPMTRFQGDIGEVRAWDRVVDPRVDLKPLITPVVTAAWAMEDYDEDAPRQVTDDSGYQRPLTLTDAPGVTWCDSYASAGLCFDGVSGAATADPVVRTDQSFSVSGWVRLTDAGVSRSLFAQQGSRGAAFTVRYDRSVDRWSFAVTDADSDIPTVVRVQSAAAPLLNAWTFVEAVYDAQAHKIRLFVDDQLQSEATVAAIWNAGGPFTVGRTLHAGAAAEYFAGDIDEVRAVAGASRPVGSGVPTNVPMLFRSGITGKCLDNTGGQSVDGNPVTSYACNGGYHSQLWTLHDDSTVRIAGKCLDVRNSATTPGTPVRLSACNSQPGQQWQPGPENSLRNPNSGLCLDIPNGSSVDGTALQIWDCYGNGAQRWTPQWTGVGMIRSGILGKCVDNNEGLAANGNPIQTYDCNGGPNSQVFTLLGDGTVRVAGKCMEVRDSGTNDGSKVQLWACRGTPNQQWAPGPYNSLRNPVSGRCLDVRDTSTENRVQLQIWECYGNRAQEWFLP